MDEPIGRYLDNRNDFFNWINGSAMALVVLDATAKSGLLDCLTRSPQTVDSLADAVFFPADKLRRLVNYLAAHEVVELTDQGEVVATARSDALKDAASCARFMLWGVTAGGQTVPALRRGVTPFEEAFGGPFFDTVGADPAAAALFHDFMSFMTLRQQEFVLTHHRFEPFQTVADIGGNHGLFLRNILELNPDARGILFDLPAVIEDVRDRVAAAQHGDRIELVGGSFFEEVPAADLYLLKMILHDWSDDEAVEILKVLRRGMNPHGRIAIVDQLMPERPTPSEATDMDIEMLIWATGRQRKLSEFELMFDRAGLRLDRVTANPAGVSVVEGIAKR